MSALAASAPVTNGSVDARDERVEEGSPRALLYLRVSTKEQAEKDGDAEGYSIPAQREACIKKALGLGATVEEQFVERGESAKTAQRHELQRMLRYLGEHPGIDYVIVHKLDRLARNRMDDMAITLQLQAAGVRLVSCHESIDETPSGQLLHGIMASIAQFYSQNLANEVMKGTMQKVRAGGTAGQAPIGYLNVRKTNEGAEVRTVDIDSERCAQVQWAFETYATGEYTLTQLTEELEDRGLRLRATKNRPERPLQRSRVHDMLKNRYYIGYVTYQGIEYQGRHTAIISEALFEKVQQILSAHRLAGDRSSRRTHYLKGTLKCARCGSKLGYMIGVGNGGPYEYFFCLGNHERRTNCGLPYLSVDAVEEEVMRIWRHEELRDPLLSEVKARLESDLGEHVAHALAERKRLTSRIGSIRRDRIAWAEKAAIGVVPDDIAKEKQGVLSRHLARAETDLHALQIADEDLRDQLSETLRKARDCYWAYKEAPPQLRREWNQMWWKWLDVDCDEDGPRVVEGNRTDLYEAVRHDAEVIRMQVGSRMPGPEAQEEPDLTSVGDGLSLNGLVRGTGPSSNVCSPTRVCVGGFGCSGVAWRWPVRVSGVLVGADRRARAGAP